MPRSSRAAPAIRVETADRATGYWTRSDRDPGLNARTAGIYLLRADPQTSRCWTAGARTSALSSSRSASRSGSRPRTHSEHRTFGGFRRLGSSIRTGRSRGSGSRCCGLPRWTGPFRGRVAPGARRREQRLPTERINRRRALSAPSLDQADDLNPVSGTVPVSSASPCQDHPREVAVDRSSAAAARERRGTKPTQATISNSAWEPFDDGAVTGKRSSVPSTC